MTTNKRPLEALFSKLEEAISSSYQLPLGPALDSVLERLTFEEAAALLVRWIELKEEGAPFDKELTATISSKQLHLKAK